MVYIFFKFGITFLKYNSNTINGFSYIIYKIIV